MQTCLVALKGSNFTWGELGILKSKMESTSHMTFKFHMIFWCHFFWREKHIDSWTILLKFKVYTGQRLEYLMQNREWVSYYIQISHDFLMSNLVEGKSCKQLLIGQSAWRCSDLIKKANWAFSATNLHPVRDKIKLQICSRNRKVQKHVDHVSGAPNPISASI